MQLKWPLKNLGKHASSMGIVLNVPDILETESRN